MNKRILLFLLNNLFLAVYCSYSYLSTEEAILLQDHSPCMGDCFYHDGANKCVFDWTGHEAECKSTKVKTKKYRTLKGLSCHSNCGKFHEIYDWCATKVNEKLSWDRCTKHVDLRAKATVQTNNKYVTCADECSKRTSKKPWCNTVKGRQHCDPNNKYILFARHTESHVMCSTPCALYKDEPYCYDYDGEWKKCYLNQDKDEELTKLSKHLEIHWNHGEYTQDAYKLCKTVNKKDLESSDPANVESLAQQYENEFSSVIVRVVDPKNAVTDNPDPTMRYTVVDTIHNFKDDQLILPLVYRGIITNSTLRKSAKDDSSWTAQINNNFNRMNPTGTNKRDEKGYLLALRLGGPIERFNIFPRPIRNEARWNYLEADIHNFIDRNVGSYAEYLAVLNYDPTSSTPNRPTGVGLSVKLYNENNVLCDVDGVILKDRVNILENMFFSNDPISNILSNKLVFMEEWD